jgi:hypothetical protein
MSLRECESVRTESDFCWLNIGLLFDDEMGGGHTGGPERRSPGHEHGRLGKELDNLRGVDLRDG